MTGQRRGGGKRSEKKSCVHHSIPWNSDVLMLKLPLLGCMDPKVLVGSDCDDDIFSAKNVEVDACEDHPSYWLAPVGATNASFVVDFGCEVKLSQISLKNTRSGGENDR